MLFKTPTLISFPCHFNSVSPLLLLLLFICRVLQLYNTRKDSSIEDNYTTNKLNNLNISYKWTYHYDENTDKHSNKIGEKGQRMFHIVHVAEVCLLYNLLCVDHHVSHKDQQSEVELQQQIHNKMRSLRKIDYKKKRTIYSRRRSVYLELKDRRRATKDRRSKLKPHQHGQARREKSSEVEILSASGQHGCSWEADKRYCSSDKRSDKDAAVTK